MKQKDVSVFGKQLLDPATQEYVWTQRDIDFVLAVLRRRAMQGAFNPQTWCGSSFLLTFTDGEARTVSPSYLKTVMNEWEKPDG